ncbi:conserved hypothetical protein [Luteimonas sp. 9C]|uniref:DUF2971 domain-containing protein n=1 Tax=Luteimonas sp. 9C TaxID=2653148 RepID=UPI0012F43908|nr:DUF2971 domain-containing protein [Luteimonas sp. 9C]VXC20433.1 conserved hypothetical protein [Luteimonas sp. 9C]
MPDTPPPYLYKFRSFNPHLIAELCNSEIYFASPITLNDPLDSKPSIILDLPLERLEELFCRTMEESPKSGDPARELAICRYNATEGTSDALAIQQRYKLSVELKIHQMLLNWIGSTGVLSLASNWDCPLMWSHYGAQHTGVCLEYSTRDHVAKNLLMVRYDAPRSVSLQDLYDWKLKGDFAARKRVLETSFLAKAPAWSYEEEWRCLARSSGPHSVPFDLAAIYFGERCNSSVRTAIVKTMHDRSKPLHFYDVSFSQDNFALRRDEVDLEEVLQVGLRPSPALLFGRVPLSDEWASKIPIPPEQESDPKLY